MRVSRKFRRGGPDNLYNHQCPREARGVQLLAVPVFVRKPIATCEFPGVGDLRTPSPHLYPPTCFDCFLKIDWE